MLRHLLSAVTILLAVSAVSAKDQPNTESSRQILPSNFKPSQVFKNTNLVRTINLEKGYVRETINLVIQNIDSSPQSEYFIPFNSETIGKVGGLEVRDRKDASKPAFRVEVVQLDVTRWEQHNDNQDPELIGIVLRNSTVLNSSNHSNQKLSRLSASHTISCHH